MREIKFRAWQKYHKKMVEVTSISFDDNGEINGVATFVENQAPQRISYRGDLLGRFFLKDERGMVLELMQYTGLKDKNGVEIYEGDILKTFSNINKYTDSFAEDIEPKFEYTTIVRDGACFKTTYKKRPSYVLNENSGSMVEHMEVIGNIYENPELLERETE